MIHDICLFIFTKVVINLRYGAQSCWFKTNKDMFTTSCHYNYMYVKWETHRDHFVSIFYMYFNITITSHHTT